MTERIRDDMLVGQFIGRERLTAIDTEPGRGDDPLLVAVEVEFLQLREDAFRTGRLLRVIRRGSLKEIE